MKTHAAMMIWGPHLAAADRRRRLAAMLQEVGIWWGLTIWPTEHHAALLTDRRASSRYRTRW